MTKIFGLLKYLKAYKGSVFLNIFFNILYTLFSFASLGFVMPFFDILFNPERLVLDKPVFVTSVEGLKSYLDYYISQIIIHPAFNQFTLDSDLALLELSVVTTLTPIQTLGHYSLNDGPSINATALGWGDTSSATFAFPDTLQMVDLPIVSNDHCAERTSFITENMLCAGFFSGVKDTCTGDSGGPLMVFDETSQRWHQVGITSFGVGCEAQGGFGGYTRVKNFSDFISTIICLDVEMPAAPIMDLQISGGDVTVSWTNTTDLGGYRLNYAPYPDASPIESIDMQNQRQFSITLPSGSAFFVAINAYENNCRSGLSNIDHFIIN
mgnify:CR=1 FL=1